MTPGSDSGSQVTTPSSATSASADAARNGTANSLAVSSPLGERSSDSTRPSVPPSAGPTTAPRLDAIPSQAIPRARAASVVESATYAAAAGKSAEESRPPNARAAYNPGSEVAAAKSTYDTADPASPAINSRRRPTESERRPQSGATRSWTSG